MNTTPASQLHHLLEQQVAQRPDAPAIWWQDHYSSYAELYRQVQALAAGLAELTEPGARVAVLAWNSAIYQALLYAVPAAGRIIVPLNARLAPAELCYQLRHADASLLLVTEALAEPLLGHADFPSGIHVLLGERDWLSLEKAEAPALDAVADPSAPAWLLYTSGSTGRPKGAVLTHGSLLAGLASGAQGRPVRPDDKFLYPFPLFHVAAHNTLLQHQYGACVVLLAGFDAAAALRCCRELGVTTMSLAPTMVAMLFDHPDFDPTALAAVRAIGYGASAMPLTLLARVMRETDVELSQGYGMTELSGSVAFLGYEEHRRATGRPEILASVGKPVAGVEIRLVADDGTVCPAGQEGEIIVKGPQHLLEYWRQPEASASSLKDGWFYTGDVGRFDDEGYLYVVDRKKDMIISGGENVASKEVEEVLRLHASVADAAVIGVPDARWGEAVCAVIVLRSQASAEALEQHCREYLAGYKTPRRFHFVDSLPINANGKVDKPRLRQDYSEG